MWWKDEVRESVEGNEIEVIRNSQSVGLFPHIFFPLDIMHIYTTLNISYVCYS